MRILAALTALMLLLAAAMMPAPALAAQTFSPPHGLSAAPSAPPPAPALPPPGDEAPSPAPIEVGHAVVVATYGAWQVQESPQFVAATTTNRDGTMLGFFCAKTCSFYLSPNQPCRAGGVYTALLNSDLGTLPLTMRCAMLREDGEVEYPFLIQERLEFVVGRVPAIGVAFPMPGAEFIKLLFSTNGVDRAMRDALERAIRRNKEAAGDKGPAS